MVADLIRGKKVGEAEEILHFSPHKAARIFSRLVKSAVANASHNYNIEKENLLIKSVEVGEGMVLKRWMPRAHGHASQILKRRSHLVIKLEEINKPQEAREGRKSKIQTFSYEEVKKSLEEAQKAAKMVAKEKEGEEKDKKDKGKVEFSHKEAKKGEFGPQKKIDSRPNFSRLGERFKGIKGLLRRTTKKG